MATSPYYQKTHDKWEDRPSTKTPILGKDLDQIEEGIYQNSKKLFDNGVGGAYTASKIDVNGSPQPDSGNGHLTVSVGLNNKVSGQSSQAFGTNHTVEGGYSAAFGYGNKVENTQSNECFVEGAENIAIGMYQHVEGKFNEKDPRGVGNKYVHITGGGKSDTERKNIHTLTWNGVGYYSGDVQTPTHSMAGAKNIIDLCTIEQNGHEVTIKIPLNRMIFPKVQGMNDEFGDRYDNDSEQYNAGTPTTFGFGYYSGVIDCGVSTTKHKIVFHAVISAHDADNDGYSQYGFGQEISGEAWMQFLGFKDSTPHTTDPIKGALEMSVEDSGAYLKTIYALVKFQVPEEFTITVDTINENNSNAVYNLYGGQFTDCMMLERIAALEEKVNQLLPSE